MNVAVVGAAGYLGIHIVDALLARGHSVTAVAHHNYAIHLHDKNIEILLPDEVILHTKKYDAVINLAYPNAFLLSLVKARNSQIASQINHLIKPGGNIVHASTMAVFGMQLEKPVVPVQQFGGPDDIYVVSKRHMENLLIKKFSKKNPLHLVRVGCIWGPASETWTARLAERIIFDYPVGNKFLGNSNLTDVLNAAGYFVFLAEKNSETGEKFHHLAEFAEINWSFWLKPMAEVLKTELILTDIEWPREQTQWQEFKNIVSHILPAKKMLNAALQTKYVKHYLQKITPLAPKSLKKPFREITPAPDINGLTKSDITLLRLMSTEKLFAPVIDADWEAPVSADQSLKNTLDWMRDAGHILPR